VSELPEGWTARALGSIADCRLGKMLDAAKNRGELRPYLRNTNVQWGTIDLSDIKEIRIEDDERDRYAVLPGDLLVCEGGEPGRCAVWRDDREMYLQKALHRIRPLNGTSVDYLRWFLQYATSSGALENLYTGSTIKHLPGRQLVQIVVPVPPFDEQWRIGAWLEAIDARRASIADRLATARSIAARLRTALLAAACSGRLTSDWRDDQGIGVDEWPILPMASACTKVQSGTTPKLWHGGADGGVPFLKVYNIVDQQLDFDYKPQFIARDLHGGAMRRARALPGDVLMNIVGPPLGKVAVVSDQYPEWSINQALTLFRPSPQVTTGWLYVFLCSGASVRSVLNRTRGQVGQVNISLTQCREIDIPVPSVAEQHEIVRRVGSALVAADLVEAAVEAAEDDLEGAVRGSLAKAFRGELALTDAQPIIGVSESSVRHADRSPVATP
jgi:type I restriction enzyme S subunit